MTLPQSRLLKAARVRLLKPAFWLVSIAGFLCRTLLIAWASLAAADDPHFSERIRANLPTTPP
jgi:hypothetical protein